MPTMNLIVANGNLKPVATAAAYQDDQVITWNLSPIGAFADVPITFPDPVSNPYSPWPGSAAQPGPSPNFWTAVINKPLGSGTTVEKYKYDVHLKNGTTIDPDIENNPGPGTMMGS